MTGRIFTLLSLVALLIFSPGCSKEPGITKVLIVDGQNNHTVWPKSTMMMKKYLEDTGLFEVDIRRTQFTWRGEKWLPHYPLEDGRNYNHVKQPQTDPQYILDLDGYDLVISNFGWKAAPWPQESKDELEHFVSQGGGLVVVHAADNAWPEWDEFNRMIGLGGWGDRNEEDGPYVYYDKEGKLIYDTTPGRAGSHGPQHEILITIREDHPITAGMPDNWLHTKDECYDRLRGPAENMTVLATAYSSPEFNGTGRHEPMMMVLEYGRGKIFHTTLGHEDYSFEGVGFITSFLRGAEWAATGEVTIPIPEDFPTAFKATNRDFGGPVVAEN